MCTAGKSANLLNPISFVSTKTGVSILNPSAKIAKSIGSDTTRGFIDPSGSVRSNNFSDERNAEIERQRQSQISASSTSSASTSSSAKKAVPVDDAGENNPLNITSGTSLLSTG